MGRSVVLCDLNVAREYGHLKQQLRDRGRPIPENDIWIAAAAKTHNLVLVTQDRHVDEIDGLQTTDWAAAS